MVAAWTDPQSLTEYTSAPTPFWLVKLMTGYTLLSVSVSAMAVVMLTGDVPDPSLALAAGLGLFALALLALVAALYRPFLVQPASAPEAAPPRTPQLSAALRWICTCWIVSGPELYRRGLTGPGTNSLIWTSTWSPNGSGPASVSVNLS